MKNLWIVGMALCFLPPAPAAPDAGWSDVDSVFGQPGKDLAGDVHRFSWPRTDLKVRIGEVTIEPALAIGSWGAFRRAGSVIEVMGDLALLGPEVAPVLRSLEGAGFEILAVHNHLIDETPRVIYVHYSGRGEGRTLAQSLRAALQKSATPLAAPAPSSGPPKLDEAREKAFAAIQQILGRKGAMAGAVLQFGVPRAAPIEEGGMEMPPTMGMSNAVNFQMAGSRVATTGDFVLTADEVNPVIRELHAHGIDVTALHSHMLREQPRLFFMHFWGVDSPERIAKGIKAALAKMAVK